jgi:predicted alpha/beta-fold hydrolase
LKNRKENLFSDIDFEKVYNSKTLYTFDQNLTIKIYKINSVEEYYSQSSSFKFLKYSKIPIFIIHAKVFYFLTFS